MQISNTPSDTKISSNTVLENHFDSLQKRRDRLMAESSLFFYYWTSKFNRYVPKLEKRTFV